MLEPIKRCECGHGYPAHNGPTPVCTVSGCECADFVGVEESE